MGFWNWVKKNTGKIIGAAVGLALAPVTGGTSLAIAYGGIGLLAGSAIDADIQKRENENKQLALAGKAGEAITGQVNNIQDARNKKSQEIEQVLAAIRARKQILNDPNASESDKSKARSELAFFESQLSNLEQEIKDYDKKIEDLLKNIPDGSEKNKGGLINLGSMDPQTKMIMGAIIFLIVYFAFIKEKDS